MSVVEKSWRCRIGRHAMVRRHNGESGGGIPFYLECSRCGKYKDIPGALPPGAFVGL